MQALLLDQACGELSPPQQAALRAHLASCDACSREAAQLSQTRTLAAELLREGEPSSRFDAKILEAARAEARSRRAGTGQTIEVAAEPAQASVTAGRIRAKDAPIRVAPAQRPRWSRRVAPALAALSLAAATVLGGLWLQRREKLAPSPSPETYAVRVHAPEATSEQPASPPLVAQSQPRPSPAKPAASPQIAPDLLAQNDEVEAPSESRARSPRMAASAKRTEAPRQNVEAGRPGAEEVAASSGVPAAAAAGGVAHAAPQAGPAAVARAQEPPQEAAAAPSAGSGGPAAADQGALDRAAWGSGAGAAANQLGGHAQPATPPAAKAEQAESPAQLEAKAAMARRAGDYRSAAELYLAGARSRSDAAADRGPAAWDLTHAIECLGASGDFSRARSIETELDRRFPEQVGPRSAAARALRTAQVAPE